jgi:hypothetical protein
VANDDSLVQSQKIVKLTVTGTACAGQGFTQPVGSPLATGSLPRSLAAGDFNLDGKPDLAVANLGSNDVTIILGNGNGGFTQATGSPISAGSLPQFVAAGDFNLDGKPDLAVANQGSGNVTILLGEGTGTFTQAIGSPIGVGVNPFSVAVDDFNRDGIPDLAIANEGSSNVTILVGNGTGGFMEPIGSPFETGAAPISVVAGYFNSDDQPDLALANSGSHNVTILLGNGNGGFAQAAGSPVGAGFNPQSAGIGDFNLDGKSDLAVLNLSSANLTVLLGDGSGGFTQPATSPVPVGGSPHSVGVGDFNLDGKPDLTVANLNNVTILLGDGLGGFAQPATSPVGAGAQTFAVAVGDFNLDGKPDVAVANNASNDVTILLNNCAPTITAGSVGLAQGSFSGSAVTIATVSDAEDLPGNLAVSVISGGSATGVMLGPLTNSDGTITATVAASCAATSGTLWLQVTDSAGLKASSELVINVSVNSPPTLGSYPNIGPIAAGSSTIVIPNTVPSDNILITSLTASATGFAGTISGDPETGILAIGNAGPKGNYNVTVTATDNCGATVNTIFTLKVKAH